MEEVVNVMPNSIQRKKVVAIKGAGKELSDSQIESIFNKIRNKLTNNGEMNLSEITEMFKKLEEGVRKIEQAEIAENDPEFKEKKKLRKKIKDFTLGVIKVAASLIGGEIAGLAVQGGDMLMDLAGRMAESAEAAKRLTKQAQYELFEPTIKQIGEAIQQIESMLPEIMAEAKAGNMNEKQVTELCKNKISEVVSSIHIPTKEDIKQKRKEIEERRRANREAKAAAEKEQGSPENGAEETLGAETEPKPSNVDATPTEKDNSKAQNLTEEEIKRATETAVENQGRSF